MQRRCVEYRTKVMYGGCILSSFDNMPPCLFPSFSPLLSLWFPPSPLPPPYPSLSLPFPLFLTRSHYLPLLPSPSVTNKYPVIPERISCHVALRHNRSSKLLVTQIDVRFCPSFLRRPSSRPLIRSVRHSSFAVTAASSHFLRRSNSKLMLCRPLRSSFPLSDGDPRRSSFHSRLCDMHCAFFCFMSSW